jgi:N-acetyltransferase
MPIETPTLEGTLIRLEPLSLDHLPALERVALDERIWRYMLVWVRTPEELRAWVEAALAQGSTGTQMAWVTVLRKTGEVIGSSRFLELDLRHQTVEVGHTWIAPAFEGTGVNSEVKLLQFRYAFETLGLRRVALKTHHENLHSQAAIRANWRGAGGDLPQPLRDAGRQPAPQRLVLHHTRGVARGAIETRGAACAAAGSGWAGVSTVRLSWPQAA